MSYQVYKNDLKFRQMQNIDPKKIANPEMNEMLGVDMDTVPFRLEESKHESNYHRIDLKCLNLETFPELPSNITDVVEFISVDTNAIPILPDMSSYRRLSVFDCSSNKLRQLPMFSPTITELVCFQNKITDIQNVPNVVRLDCSHNRLTALSGLEKLEILTASHNDITRITNCPQLRKLTADHNLLSNLDPNMPLLKELDVASNRDLSVIPPYPKLEYLSISDTAVVELPDLPSVKTIECTNTNIERLHHMPKLEEIIFTIGKLTKISSKYKIKTVERTNTTVTINFELKSQ